MFKNKIEQFNCEYNNNATSDTLLPSDNAIIRFTRVVKRRSQAAMLRGFGLGVLSLFALAAPQLSHAQAFSQCGTQVITFDEVVPGGGRLIPLATGTTTTVVNDQYATATGNDNFPLPNGAGVTFTATGGIVPPGAVGIATVYNADFGGLGGIAPNGQDTDLEVGGGLGNVLIVQENGSAAAPGAPDDATDGTLIIDYELPIAEFGVTFVDFEEGEAQFEFFDLDDAGNVIGGPVIITNDELAVGSGSEFEQPDPGCVLSNTIPGAVCNIDNGISTANGAGVGLIELDEIDRVVVNLGIAGASGGIDNIRVELACGTLSLQGNVFLDANGLTDATVNGVGTNLGGDLFVSLIPLTEIVNGVVQPIATPVVTASIPVNADGSYNFADIDPNTTYRVQLNTAAQTIGATPGAPDLPATFNNTGENVGAGAGSDGTPDGIIDVAVVAEDVNNVNLGIQQGVQQTAEIGDLIFFDVDGNGIFDAGIDTGIPGVEVQLCRIIDGGTIQVRDDFNAVAFNNNDGTVGWTSDWVELGDNNLPGSGEILIVPGANALRFDNDGGVAPASITRELSLQGVSGPDSASLTIEWNGSGSDQESTDVVRVQISTDGGLTFVEYLQFIGENDEPVLAVPLAPLNGASAAPGGISVVEPTENVGGTNTETITFDPQGSSQVQIRFIVTDFTADPEFLDFQSVEVTGDVAASEICETTTTNDDGFYIFSDIADGDFTVEVDPNGNTLPSGLTQTADPDGTLDGFSSLTIVGGIDNLEQDFGYQSSASIISGSVAQDVDGAGTGANVPLEDTIVQLYSDPDGDGVADVLLQTTTTDAAGNYSFQVDGLTADTDFVVVEINPANLVSVSDSQIDDGDIDNVNVNNDSIPVTVGPSEVDAGNDFVDAATASVEGTVWLDEDLDGILDIEESGITGVTVQLIDDNGVVVATTITDSAGDYSFENVVPGDYTVNVVDTTLPAGLEGTAGIGGVDPKPVTVNLGDQVQNVDFGYVPELVGGELVGAIGDRVWADANDNGIQDLGEAGIEGVSLSLLNADGSPVLDAGGAPLTATTNANGDYLFIGVPLGEDYVVMIDDGNNVGAGALVGFTPTQGPQSEGGFVSNPVTLTPTLTIVTDVDFGFDTPGLNTITDTVFFDQDGNGVQDAGDPGIANVTVNILNSSGDIVGTSVTNAAGMVTFTGLEDGDYTLVVSDNDDELAGLVGTTAEGLVPVERGQSDPVSVAGGVTVDGNDSFGYNNPGLIAGTIYADGDGNADQEPNEAGLEGTTVQLFVEDDGGNFVLVDTVVTGAGGDYQFDGLPPGNYDVIVTPPGGTLTEDPDGVLDDETNIVLGLGESSIDNDFGYTGDPDLFDLFGTVFLDPDSDGIQDVGEEPIGLVTLDLIDRDSLDIYDIIDGAIDINGDGQISGADDGSVRDNNGDIVPVIDGLLDTDGNGIVDADDDAPSLFDLGVVDGSFVDAGLNPVTQGASSDGVIATTTTAVTEDPANDGFNYSFTGLPNGNYSVAVTDIATQLAGYDITSGADTLEATIEGADVINVDFGYINVEETGSISGEVFIDENSNGTAQDDEFDITGVTVYLCESPVAGDGICDADNPSLLDSVVSDADGQYSFTGLPPAQYVVAIEPTDVPDDLDLTVQPDPVNLSEGENVTEVDFGHEPAANTGVLSGFVWTDVDRDGVLDPEEAPIGGVQISVLDTRGVLPDTDPAFPGVAVLATTVTNPDGTYIISGLVDDDGNPLADEVVDGLIVVYDNATVPANLDNIQPTNLPLGDSSYSPVNLESDEDNNISFLDFAFPPALNADLGSIAGTIYTDSNQNGDFELATDDELQSVTVNLVNGAGEVIASTQTDVNGFYTFVGLQDDTYNVVITDNANVTQDLNPLETIPTDIVIVNGADIVEQDAGFVSDVDLLSIGNRFWFDTNRDGIIGLGDPANGIPGEPGIEGITIQCWLDVNENAIPNDPSVPSSAVNVQPEPGIDNLIRTVTTDENGNYLCTSLPEGQYIVVVADSNGFDEDVDGTIIPGGAGDNLAKPWTYALTLDAATDALGNPNEPNLTADFGVSGVNTLSGTVFVEDDQLTDPAGADSVAGELDGVAGGVSPDTTNGFSDVNSDGNPTVQNVPVNLFVVLADGTEELIQTTLTDANGDYTFEGLPDGNYVVEVLTNNTGIDGYGQTGDPDLVNINGTSDLVCDSITSDVCDSRTTTAISVDAGGASIAPVNVIDIDFGYQRGFTTTPVTINYVTLQASGAGAIITWETTNEVGHAGFQVYARLADGWTVIHDGLILGGAGSSLDTRVYTFDASAVEASWFALVDVSANEEVEPHGPYRVGESYGAEVTKPAEFDWSELDLNTESQEAAAESINNKVQQLLRNERAAQ